MLCTKIFYIVFLIYYAFKSRKAWKRFRESTWNLGFSVFCVMIAICNMTYDR
eukprot:UN00087